jgi:restriction endonuclease S subunit
VDRYVGLEHIDPESLKIRRWGETSDVESSKLIFKSGDIIFGKRRAYQRKLAVADFDGICSAHAMVLRPKTDVVQEDFLPLFMQSDIFMDRAVKISVGGLSPTINWRDLAKEEFSLPPLEEQRRIAEVLKAHGESFAKVAFLKNTLTDLEQSLYEHSLDQATSVKQGSFEHFCEFITDGDHNPPKRIAEGIPHLVIASIADGQIDDSDCTYISHKDYERVSKRYAPAGGDVLLSCVASLGDTAIVPLDYTFSADRSLAVYRTKHDLLLPEYALLILRSRKSRRYFRSVAVGTAQLHLYLADLRRQQICVPSIEEQRSLSDKIADIELRVRSCTRRMASMKAIRRLILTNAVGGVQ